MHRKKCIHIKKKNLSKFRYTQIMKRSVSIIISQHVEKIYLFFSFIAFSLHERKSNGSCSWVCRTLKHHSLGVWGVTFIHLSQVLKCSLVWIL